MKKRTYTKAIDQEIIAHENQMLNLYAQKTQRHRQDFAALDCILDVGLMWKPQKEKQAEFHRVEFKNGYNCYVYCVVKKDDKEIRIQSTDGEADWYSLSAAWLVSTICRTMGRPYATLYDEIDDDIDSTLQDFLHQLQNAPPT